MQLELTSIRTDGGTQPRASYHFGVAESYAEDMAAGATFPPVTVFYDGAEYWLADGFHRIFAAGKIGRTEIDADVRQGTQQDAQWYSYSVNQTHGLRRSNDDKKRAVEAALRHPNADGMSDDLIADHVGVSRRTILEYRHQLVKFSQVDAATPRTGKDGRTRNTTNIGKKKQPPAPKPEPEDDEPLSDYEEQIAAQYQASVTAPISDPARADPKVITQEVNRLVAQYGYEDLYQIVRELAERISVDVP